MLVTEGALDDLRELLGDHTPIPVYLAGRSVMSDIVGFDIHRGCLGLGVRPRPMSIAELVGRPLRTQSVAPGPGQRRRHTVAAIHLPSSPKMSVPQQQYRFGHCEVASVSRLIVLEAVSNVDNIGGIFRSAAALGGHGVVVGPGCGDPLYRKAIRTSIGATLRVPFAAATLWPEALHDLQAAGFTLVGLTPEAWRGTAGGRGRRPPGAGACRADRGSRIAWASPRPGSPCSPPPHGTVAERRRNIRGGCLLRPVGIGAPAKPGVVDTGAHDPLLLPGGRIDGYLVGLYLRRELGASPAAAGAAFVAFAGALFVGRLFAAKVLFGLGPRRTIIIAGIGGGIGGAIAVLSDSTRSSAPRSS